MVKCTAVCCRVFLHNGLIYNDNNLSVSYLNVMQYVAMCCIVLQCVPLQHEVTQCNTLQHVEIRHLGGRLHPISPPPSLYRTSKARTNVCSVYLESTEWRTGGNNIFHRPWKNVILSEPRTTLVYNLALLKVFCSVLQCVRHVSHRPLKSVLCQVSRFACHNQSLRICVWFWYQTPLPLLRYSHVQNDKTKAERLLNEDLRVKWFLHVDLRAKWLLNDALRAAWFLNNCLRAGGLSTNNCRAEWLLNDKLRTKRLLSDNLSAEWLFNNNLRAE